LEALRKLERADIFVILFLCYGDIEYRKRKISTPAIFIYFPPLSIKEWSQAIKKKYHPTKANFIVVPEQL
jgi:hypothetical protein